MASCSSRISALHAGNVAGLCAVKNVRIQKLISLNALTLSREEAGYYAIMIFFAGFMIYMLFLQIVVSNFVFPHPNYQCLTALRILYQKENNVKLWEKLTKLESHCKERKETEKYEGDRIAIAQFIRKFFKLEEKFSEEEILRVCGILQVGNKLSFYYLTCTHSLLVL